MESPSSHSNQSDNCWLWSIEYASFWKIVCVMFLLSLLLLFIPTVNSCSSRLFIILSILGSTIQHGRYFPCVDAFTREYRSIQLECGTKDSKSDNALSFLVDPIPYNLVRLGDLLYRHDVLSSVGCLPSNAVQFVLDMDRTVNTYTYREVVAAISEFLSSLATVAPQEYVVNSISSSQGGEEIQQNEKKKMREAAEEQEEWLLFADPKSIAKFKQTQQELRWLLGYDGLSGDYGDSPQKGANWHVGIECNSNSNKKSSSRTCLFQRIVHRYNTVYILGAHLNSSSSSSNGNSVRMDDGISALVNGAEELFNNRFYDAALTVAYSALNRTTVAAFYDPFVQISDTSLEQLVQATIIISEVEKLKGKLKTSTLFSMYAMRLRDIYLSNYKCLIDGDGDVCQQQQQHQQQQYYSASLALSQSAETTRYNHARSALMRLRMIIALPPLPPTYEQAKKNRAQIIDDLISFSQEIQHLGTVVSLEMLQWEVSATPFTLVHQSINDLPFQQVFANVLYGMCPQLHFTAPWLLLSHTSPPPPPPPPPTTTTTTTTTLYQVPQHQQEQKGLTEDGENASNSYNNNDKGHSARDDKDKGDVDKKKVMRIGFISAHFSDHSIGKILVEMIIFLQHFSDSSHPLSKQLGEELKLELVVYYVDNGVRVVRPNNRSSSSSSSRGSGIHTGFDSSVYTTVVAPGIELDLTHKTEDYIISLFEKQLNVPPTTTPRSASSTTSSTTSSSSTLSSSSRFVRLPADVSVIRQVVSTHELDFLFFADVGMELITYLTAFSRLARYQATWWGHPVTTGLDTMDYFISLDEERGEAGVGEGNGNGNGDIRKSRKSRKSRNNSRGEGEDEAEAEGNEGHYHEQLVRMEAVNSAPIPQVQKVGNNDPTDTSVLTKAGLPTDAKIALVLGRLFKIHPTFDDIVVQLLYSWISPLLITSTEAADYDDNSVYSGRRRRRGTGGGGIYNSNSQSEHEALYVVFVAEENTSLNEALFQRIKLASFRTVQAALLAIKRGGAQDEEKEKQQENSVAGAGTRRIAQQKQVVDDDDDDDAQVLVVVNWMLKHIKFVSYDNYFPMLMRARLVLDTYPYGGCLTAHDALSNGIPVVTLPAPFLRGRFTAAMYRQMGHTDLIAHNSTHYIQLANRLLSDDVFRDMQFQTVLQAFHQNFHRNRAVALEWLAFVSRVIVA